ncbi:Cytosol aminopeptidase PepA [hydrothermal vent metagenome]|uniref:leucyl aminopeptidase n=1 Tax=hydrothermal vent metagenome TaxID=652676 RepID=A0A3B1DSB4_9ZZZZ
MQLNLTTKNVQTDIEIILVINKQIKSDKNILKKLNFKANDEECVLLVEQKKIYVGCQDNKHDTIRLALSCAIKKLNNTGFKSAKIISNKYIRAIVDGLLLGCYTFNKYKSKKQKQIDKIIYIQAEKITKKNKNEFDEALNICEAVNMVRTMVNTAPDDFYPDIMAVEASNIARENQLECKIYDEEYLKKNGMSAMSAVGRASCHKSKLIHLTYRPINSKKRIVLVGKGLTYDSGGLSLKPSDFMVTMKSDKSGGCAVLGIMSVVSKLNLPFEIHGIVGAVENMIGGDAYKPDDVLIAKNGTTIEIRNTDAEGRLVLADCLCYAQDEIEDIDCILDFATLTGACVVGVGHYTSGVMGNNNQMNYQIVQSALDCGELATSLPFNRYLKKTINSKIADICNISSTRYGGAITAGMFLEHFIKDENKQKWAHIDIAGPAFVEEEWGYNPYGASGAGVRLAIEFIKNL